MKKMKELLEELSEIYKLRDSKKKEIQNLIMLKKPLIFSMNKFPRKYFWSVMKYRFFDGLDLVEAGRKLDVTRERIRQCEAKVIETIDNSIEQDELK